MNTKANLLDKKKNLAHCYTPCYTINRILTPFPERALDRIKPPASEGLSEANESLAFDSKVSEEEEIQKSIEKAERIVINNFYLGGGLHTIGAIDYLYKGVNVFNGKKAA